MIFAAGLGTRLRPLTDEKPKALVPVVNKPVIQWNIEYLKSYGVTRIIVNAHHHSAQVQSFLDGGRPFGIPIEVRVEPRILGTGGGIKNTEDFWDDEPFIVVNSDVITNIPLDRAYAHHRKSGALATMVLHDRPPYNKIRVDPHACISEIPRAYGPEGLAFTGIHIISPDLLAYLPEGTFSDIVDHYRHLIRTAKPIAGFVVEGHYWHDIGNLPSYFKANRERSEQSFTIDAEARMHPSVRLEEWAVVGRKCLLKKNARIQRSILWEGARVGPGEYIQDSVLTPNQSVVIP